MQELSFPIDQLWTSSRGIKIGCQSRNIEFRAFAVASMKRNRWYVDCSFKNDILTTAIDALTEAMDESIIARTRDPYFTCDCSGMIYSELAYFSILQQQDHYINSMQYRYLVGTECDKPEAVLVNFQNPPRYIRGYFMNWIPHVETTRWTKMSGYRQDRMSGYRQVKLIILIITPLQYVSPCNATFVQLCSCLITGTLIHGKRVWPRFEKMTS